MCVFSRDRAKPTVNNMRPRGQMSYARPAPTRDLANGVVDNSIPCNVNNSSLILGQRLRNRLEPVRSGVEGVQTAPRPAPVSFSASGTRLWTVKSVRNPSQTYELGQRRWWGIEHPVCPPGLNHVLA